MSSLTLPPTSAPHPFANVRQLRTVNAQLRLLSSRAPSSGLTPPFAVPRRVCVLGGGWRSLHERRAQRPPHVNASRRNSTTSSASDPRPASRPRRGPALFPRPPKRDWLSANLQASRRYETRRRHFPRR